MMDFHILTWILLWMFKHCHRETQTLKHNFTFKKMWPIKSPQNVQHSPKFLFNRTRPTGTVPSRHFFPRFPTDSHVLTSVVSAWFGNSATVLSLSPVTVLSTAELSCVSKLGSSTFNGSSHGAHGLRGSHRRKTIAFLEIAWTGACLAFVREGKAPMLICSCLHLHSINIVYSSKSFPFYCAILRPE